MRNSARRTRHQAGGLTTKVNYGELAIILILLMSLAGMATCAIGLKIEQRIQREALMMKRNIFIPLVVIWAVSQVTFMSMVCIHLARVRSNGFQSYGPSRPVPRYILRTVGMVLIATILQFAISNFSASSEAVDICSWIPLFLCASAIGNAVIGNGAESNLLAVQSAHNPAFIHHADDEDGDDEAETGQQPGHSNSQSQQHGQNSAASQQNFQQQQQQQDGLSASNAVSSLVDGFVHSFAQAAGGDAAQGMSN